MTIWLNMDIHHGRLKYRTGTPRPSRDPPDFSHIDLEFPIFSHTHPKWVRRHPYMFTKSFPDIFGDFQRFAAMFHWYLVGFGDFSLNFSEFWGSPLIFLISIWQAENHQKSMNITENHWKSLKNHSKSPKITENHRESFNKHNKVPSEYFCMTRCTYRKSHVDMRKYDVDISWTTKIQDWPPPPRRHPWFYSYRQGIFYMCT